MPLTTAGRNFIANAIINNGSPVFFTNAVAHLGAGDNTAIFAQAHTDLQAATNKFRQPMEATYPQIATNVITFRALFATGDANYAWEEFAVFNAAAAGTMLTRKAQALGTKTSAAQWQLTVDVTVTNADEV